MLKGSFNLKLLRSKTIDLTSLLVEKDFKTLADELSKIEIGILFNNAGIAEYKGLFQSFFRRIKK